MKGLSTKPKPQKLIYLNIAFRAYFFLAVVNGSLTAVDVEDYEVLEEEGNGWRGNKFRDPIPYVGEFASFALIPK